MSTASWLREITLTGKLVSLRPLSREHAPALLAAAADGELWRLWYTSIPDAESLEGYIDCALAEQSAGRALPFVVIENATGDVVGSTRFCHADPVHKRVEIGYTWYASRCQRTGVNTECKHLLLSHAFEELKAIAVEFRTHWHNTASRNAIARLGAKQDGVLRHHQRLPDGSYRDTVVFSITNHEWPAVRNSLAFRLRD